MPPSTVPIDAKLNLSTHSSFLKIAVKPSPFEWRGIDYPETRSYKPQSLQSMQDSPGEQQPSSDTVYHQAIATGSDESDTRRGMSREPPPRLSTCVACQRLKTACKTTNGSSFCDRCLRLDRICVRRPRSSSAISKSRVQRSELNPRTTTQKIRATNSRGTKSSAIISHLTSPQEKNCKWACRDCNKSYPEKRHLTRHIQSHRCPMLFICSSKFCSETFSDAQARSQHLAACGSSSRKHCISSQADLIMEPVENPLAGDTGESRSSNEYKEKKSNMVKATRRSSTMNEVVSSASPRIERSSLSHLESGEMIDSNFEARAVPHIVSLSKNLVSNSNHERVKETGNRRQDLRFGGIRGPFSIDADIPPRYAALNLKILDNYEGMHASESRIDISVWHLRDAISSYAALIRGFQLSDQLWDLLSVLEKVTPFAELEAMEQEETKIRVESRANLLNQLRDVFDVPSGSQLTDTIRASYPELTYLKFEPFICRFLAHLVDKNVFSAKPHAESVYKDESIHQFHETLLGKEMALKARHCRLLTQLQEDGFKQHLESRALQLAQVFYLTLHPFSQFWLTNPNNVAEKHLSILQDITRRSLKLSAELEARKGAFSTFWPRLGDHFNNKFHVVDQSQVDDLQMMDNKTKVKQVVEYTLMFGIQQQQTGYPGTYVYAHATILLRRPYVDYTPHESPPFSPLSQ